MSNGVLEIKESEIDEIKSFLNKSSNKMNNATTNLTSGLSNISSTGLMSKCVSSISKQLDTITTNIGKTNNSVSKAYENMSLIENSLAEKAESIDVPLDFVKNDSSFQIQMNHGDLFKENGKNINANNDSTEQDLDFKNSLQYNEKLKNIVKEYEEKNKTINEYTIDKEEINKLETNDSNINNEMEESIINSEKLKEMKNKETSIDVSIEEANISKKLIYQLNKNINMAHPEFNDSFSISFINLDEMPMSSLNEIEYKDSYSIYRKRLFNILRKGNYVLKNNKK